jgi:hypothetical protein
MTKWARHKLQFPAPKDTQHRENREPRWRWQEGGDEEITLKRI